MNRNARKVLNGLLADALRANGLPRNGPVWDQAKAVRDDLIAQGVREKSACNKAAFRMARAENCAREVLEIVPEPVTHATTRKARKTNARPKSLPAQAKRVQEGKVLRDSQGRILPAWVGEELAAING